MHVGESEVSTLVFKGQPFMVNPKAVQHGCVEIVDVNWFFSHVVTEVICFAVDDARPNPTTGHPLRKASWMVITTVIGFRQAALAIDCSSKFAAPNNQRVIKHSTLF